MAEMTHMSTHVGVTKEGDGGQHLGGAELQLENGNGQLAQRQLQQRR